MLKKNGKSNAKDKKSLIAGGKFMIMKKKLRRQ